MRLMPVCNIAIAIDCLKIASEKYTNAFDHSGIKFENLTINPPVMEDINFKGKKGKKGKCLKDWDWFLTTEV